MHEIIIITNKQRKNPKSKTNSQPEGRGNTAVAS